MKILTFLLIISTLLIVSGCSVQPNIDWSNPQEIATHITIQHDSFKKITTYRGPNYNTDYLDQLFIRAWKAENSTYLQYQIYVCDGYSGDWRFYDTCYDSEGNSLSVTEIKRDVSYCGQYGCTLEEHLGLNISKQYLENHKNNGLRFKIYGTGGQQVYNLPGSYISAFLNHVK